MREEEIVIILGIFVITAGIIVIWMAMQSRRHFREMAHRERLAMIERGLIPSPESDPMAFETAVGTAKPAEPWRGNRSRSAGVTMIALGLAFMFLLSFTAREPEVGIGVGGAFAILGVAFFVNSMLSTRPTSYLPPTSMPRPSRPEPREPPFSN